MKLGPTFGLELVTADCNEGVSWMDDDSASILIAPDKDQAYHDKIAAVMAAHDPTKQLPITVTRKQARLVLLHAGILPQVEAALNKAQDENLIWYQDSTDWTETDPHVQAIGQLLSMTADQIHQLFVLAQSA